VIAFENGKQAKQERDTNGDGVADARLYVKRATDRNHHR
jgi:hypothetical protein